MYDIVIIGSGPAGLSAAVYGQRAGHKLLVIEKEYEGTGQIAYSNRVDNYLGFYGTSGFDLGEKFRAHAVELGVEFLEDEVNGFAGPEVNNSEDNEHMFWKVKLASGQTLQTRTIIDCAGAVHRKLGIPGEEEFAGLGISYCATCDGAFYEGKNVAVIGGGDTAIDDALYLAGICNKVYLIHRRQQFRASAISVERLRKCANVEFVLDEQVEEVLGEKAVQQVVCKSGRKLDVSGVFIAVGMNPSTELLSGIVQLNEQGYVVAGEDGVTNRPGFLVAGDIRTKALRQVVTAVADGANAVVSAGEYLQKI